MTLERICRRHVELAQLDDTAQAAALRMRARSVGTLVVLDAHRHPIGIVTARDLAVDVLGHDHDARHVRVRDVMRRVPVTVNAQTSIPEGLTMMRSLGVRRLPVVDRSGRLVGVVLLDDILRMIADEYGDMGSMLFH